jgi:mRNA interferase MazF
MAVTSQTRSVPGFGELRLTDWQRAGLLKPSAIKPIFATLEQILIVRRLGVLPAPDQTALRMVIAAVLG